MPLLLAYIPEHFVSVVPLLPASRHVPLVTRDGFPIPVRFEPSSFLRSTLSSFMDVERGSAGLPVCCWWRHPLPFEKPRQGCVKSQAMTRPPPPNLSCRIQGRAL
jgi:hypothetical protein